MKLIDQWLEVFRAGDYGDKGTYTTADLDELVKNYDPKFHEAPAVVGHPEHNKPAHGWVESLKRVGDTLFAKFKQIEPAFEEALINGRFKKRSISFYKEPKLMLRHVGFLGAMPPEVKGLTDPVFRDDEMKSTIIELTDEGENMDPKVLAQAVKDALTEVFGGKKPSTFSEEDVTKLTTAAVTKATELLTSTVTSLSETVTKLTTQVKDFTEKQTSTDTVAAVKAKVDALISPLKAGTNPKWIPAFTEMGLEKVLAHLVTSDQKVTFSEGAEKVERNLAEVFCDFLSTLPAIVPLGEIAKGAQRQTGSLIQFNEAAPNTQVVGADLAEASAQYAKDNKVSYGEALRIVRRQQTAGAASNGQA
jgi:hypothetical protein